MLKDYKKCIALAVLIIINLILILPETSKERIHPYDGALYAADGAFFLSAFKDLPNLISSPINWMRDYYHQYPALSLNRHPPIFGMVESIIFSLFGISAVSAKLTVLLFSILLLFGWFFTFCQFFKDKFIAFFSVLLMVTLPMSVKLGAFISVDIPSMMFLAWGYYFYANYLTSPGKRYRYAILTSIFLVCSLYTYQLPLFGVIALFLHILIIDWKNCLKKSDFYIASILFTFLMLPLVLITIRYNDTSLNSLYSGPTQDSLTFVPVLSRLSIENLSFYLKILWRFYPVPTIGLALWGIAKLRVPPQKYELLFLIWFLIGYIGYSIIPSKVPRYAYYFVIPALPLTVIGIRDSFKMFPRNWEPDNLFFKYRTIPVFIMLLWNVFGILHDEGTFAARGIDKAASWTISHEKAATILYNGAFESGFIFYIRKYDDNRQSYVLRSGNEFNQPDKIMDDIKRHKVNIVVIESENLRPKDMSSGIYDRFYTKLNSIVHEESFFKYLRDFPVLYGKKEKKSRIFLRVYRVDNG